MADLVYRVAALDDAHLAADLMTAAYPALSQDPVLTRYRWERPRRGYAFGRYIVERAGRPIAFTGWVHGPWEQLPDRHCEVETWLDAACLDRELLRSIWSWISDRAIEQEAGMLLAYAAEDELEMLASLATLGFRIDRVDQVSELDLTAHGARIVSAAAEAKTEAVVGGIQFVTLAAWQDLDKIRKLHELDSATRQDIPHTLPILHESLEDFARRTSAPDRPADRLWIALDAGRPVAMTYLKFPPVRGSVWTGYTCSRRDHRGRGLARAVKLQSLAQAVELGVPMVRTDNDAENAPMLHINRELGYERRPGFVAHLKPVARREDG